MSSIIKTILIMTVIVLITIWLFSEPTTANNIAEKKEYYDNSVTEHNVEPDDYIHSYGVRFMPHLANRVEVLTDGDSNSFRTKDHTDYQMDGEAFVYKCNKEPVLAYEDQGQDIRNVVPDTSLQRTYQHGDRVLDSNDINGVCSKQSLLTNDIYAHSDEIHDVAPRMDMSRDEHHSLVDIRPHMKTYIEIDESSGDFNDKRREQTLKFEELSDTVNRYRNDTLSSIRNGNEHNATMRQRYQFYDGV